MKLVKDIAMIKTDIKYLKENNPIRELESKIKFNRALILILLTSYSGMIYFVLQK